MKFHQLLVVLIGLCSGGCGVLRVAPTPDLSGYTAHDVLLRARQQNWHLRVSADSAQLRGRVNLVTRDSVRLGTQAAAIGDVTTVERFAPIDVGGTRTGVVIGGVAGLVLGYLGREFWEYGNEQSCDAGCNLKIFAPSVAISALLGALIGSLVDPPARAWSTVWKAPQ